MYRSGTTWQFNALRIMLEHAHPGDVYSCFWQNYDRKKRKAFNLIKAHKWRGRMAKDADIIFSTYRHPKQVRESMARHAKLITDKRFANGSNVARFDEFWNQSQLWANQPHAEIVSFETIIHNPHAAVEQMADRLNINVDIERVVTEINALKVPDEGFDPVTLLHANHITKPNP